MGVVSFTRNIECAYNKRGNLTRNIGEQANANLFEGKMAQGLQMLLT